MSKQIVEQVKLALEQAGADLSGPCGAFKITKRVAWHLKDKGFGLLSKTSGNNCEDFATDIVVDENGGYYDILGDGGGANDPQWPETPEAGDKSRWRAPVDPRDVIIVPPEPDPEPVDPKPEPKPEFDPTPILTRLTGIETHIIELWKALEGLGTRIDILENTPFPELEVTGNTSRVWGHTHVITIPVTKKHRE